ncbi:MAG: hypothetical protein HGA44_14145, partial [Cellulomonadaceae bacterium]|nr:hypothetical protein [Cellulomonadaceae bacterium]
MTTTTPPTTDTLDAEAFALARDAALDGIIAATAGAVAVDASRAQVRF